MSCLRHPKTAQERRASQSGYCRAKRNLYNLPDAWDDILRKDIYDRCWKRYRRTQYKVVNKFQVNKKNSSHFSKSMVKRDHFHFNHKHCHWHRARCTYCIKYHIWDYYDHYMDRKYKQYLAKQKQEMDDLWLSINTG